jgi:MFS family permease
MGTKSNHSPYRWAVLAAYMLLALASQIQWVALAPVSRAAERFYAGQIAPGSFFGIDFLAMVYLILYLVMALPASFIIDTYGLKVGLGIGAILAGVAGLAKGLFAQSFAVVLIAQAALALSQPFILNAATTLGARWFPLRERGLAVGFASLAQYLGIVAAMVIGPALVDGNASSIGYGLGVGKLLLVYGIATAAAAIASLLVVKERPALAVEGGEERLGALKGLKSLLASSDYRILLLLFTIGLGIFNALSSMVDTMASHIGVDDSDGLIGTFMIVGGIAGALLLPMLSDATRRRKPFLVICMAGMVPGVACLAFAGSLAVSSAGAYAIAKVAAGVLGFFVMSAGPIGFQYAAEIGRPAPESTSQGLLLLVGQISGIVFMSLMGSKALIGPVLAGFVVLSILSFLSTIVLRESELMTGSAKKRRVP